tara:strand:+ start:409 stop:597 length:189 start_codon:yes stop_codon:yes gene_type:complete
MLIKFKGFNIEDFFVLGNKAIAVDFLIILFVPQARISKRALLISLGISISIGLIFSLNILLN